MPALSPKAAPSASCWGAGETIQAVQHRLTQVLERRICQLDLGLHPHGVGDPEAVSCGERVLQQRGLADSRVAP